MKKGITKTGFKYEVDENVLDKISFVKTLARIDEGKMLETFSAIEQLMTKEQAEALYEHCEDSMEKLEKEIINIFNAMGEEDEEVKKD